MNRNTITRTTINHNPHLIVYKITSDVTWNTCGTKSGYHKSISIGDMNSKGPYSSRRDHEYGKPLVNPPSIGDRQVTWDEYRDFINRERSARGSFL